MFPANLVEATFKQVSGSQGKGAAQPRPAWARLGGVRFTQQVSLTPGLESKGSAEKSLQSPLANTYPWFQLLGKRTDRVWGAPHALGSPPAHTS